MHGKEKYVVTKRFFAIALAIAFLLTCFFFSVCGTDKLTHNCECGECIVCALRDTFRDIIKSFVALAAVSVILGCGSFLKSESLPELYRDLFCRTPVFLKVCLLN